MKSIIVRIVSIVIVVMIIFQYNGIVNKRNQVEAKMLADYQAALAAQAAESDDKPYEDGVYTGEAQGYGGIISVEAVVENGWLQELNIVSAENEDVAYLSMAEDIIPKFIIEQSADVDTITGATLSSTGIREATRIALEKAAK